MFRHDSNKAQVAYQDVAAYFSEEEWKLLHDWQKELYNKVMTEVHQALISLGPLITATVCTLRTKEMKDLCSVDHQDSDARQSIDDDIATSSFSFWKKREEMPSLKENPEMCIKDRSQEDVTPIVRIRIKEEIQTGFMGKQGSDRMEVLNKSKGQAEITPLVTVRIKEEVETYLMGSRDSDRMEHLNSSEGQEDVTPIARIRFKEEIQTGFMGKQGSDRMEVLNKSKDHATVTMQQNCEESVKCPEWTLPSKASSRKNSVLPISEKQIQFGCEMWSEQYQGLAEVETNQHTISFGNPSNSNLDRKTSILESAGKWDTYLNDVVNAQLPTCLQQNLPSCTQQNYAPDMFLEYKKSINMNADYLQQEITYMKDRSFKCVDCEKSFRWKKNLIRHQATHREDRPFQCTICQKCFNRSDNLIIHQRKHTGERPYKCTICMKAFRHNRNLIMHQAKHMGQNTLYPGDVFSA